MTLDENLNFNDQVKNVCRSSLCYIRALRHIRPSLPIEMANVVACALVQSRVDYVIHCTQECHLLILTIVKLVQNTLARVVTLTRKRDHIQLSLKRLHWLPIRQRVDFKVALLTYSIRHSGEPQHLNSLLMGDKLDLYGLPKNIYLLFHEQNYLPLFELSVLLHQYFGTICH